MEQTTIFISSSSDMLEEERMCLKDFEEQWNLNKHPDNPIKIIKWEPLNKSRTLNETFQSGIDPYIISSHLIIFLFSNRLGIHTNTEFELAKAHNKHVRVLLKEPIFHSLHKQSREWLNDFIKLREFIESIETKGVFSGDGPIMSMSDFKLQLTDCIEEYINLKKSDILYQLGNRSANFETDTLARAIDAFTSISPEILEKLLILSRQQRNS